MPPPRLHPRQDVCRTTHVAPLTMRPPCWQNGITVSTKDGKEIGESKAAAFGAVAQVPTPPARRGLVRCLPAPLGTTRSVLDTLRV
jgi:hypothetical protein